MQPIIAFTGASASGKSRLLAGIDFITRSTGLDLNVTIPERFTTRNKRDNETFDHENQFLSVDAFFDRVAAGEIDVYWGRNVGGANKNYYGFSLKPHLDAGRTVILSANNYLDWRNVSMLHSLRQSNRFFVARVWASDHTREERLRARRPRLSDDEFASRMADVPADKLPPTDFAIRNDKEEERQSPWEFVRLLSFLKVSANYFPVPNEPTVRTELALSE